MFLEKTGGFSLEDGNLMFNIVKEKAKKIADIEKKIKQSKETYHDIQSLAFMKNGGSFTCDACGFHMFDECICDD
ncbi:hypothetical protein A9Q74_11785 [Colwellia sp. 39_35_sub15_T18]|nr:hypothetical protein A9Q74_11785 [Colwellia sp. 39_35_sub15_T18]